MGQKSPNANAKADPYADPYAHADPYGDPYAHGDPGDCLSFCWCDGVGLSDGQCYQHSCYQ